MSCLIIGDSIAQGVAEIRKDCEAYTQNGISTHGWVYKWLHKLEYSQDNILISLGSNDGRYNGLTIDDLYHLRFDLEGKKVTWILPAIHDWVGDIILEIANDYGDTVLRIPDLSKDGVHPTKKGYNQLAKEFK